jgi:hypothetical protein
MAKRAVVAACLCLAAASASGDDAAALVGSWRLVAYDRHDADGRVTPVYGPSPAGRLSYDAGGRMSVHLVDPRRKAFAAGDSRAGTDDEVRSAFQGYFGYFGRYSVDVKEKVVTHRVEGASYPNYVGSEQRRHYALAGERLTLRTPPRGAPGAGFTLVLVWERER